MGASLGSTGPADQQDVPAVLVVDDDPAIRELLVLALEMEGYRVLQAADGSAALAVFDTEHVDLVTLDVMMPVLDGWQVADRLRSDPRTRTVPRVMISGMPVDELMRACASRQAAAIIAKPFDVEKVVALVARLIAEVPQPRPA